MGSYFLSRALGFSLACGLTLLAATTSVPGVGAAHDFEWTPEARRSISKYMETVVKPEPPDPRRYLDAAWEQLGGLSREEVGHLPEWAPKAGLEGDRAKAFLHACRAFGFRKSYGSGFHRGREISLAVTSEVPAARDEGIFLLTQEDFDHDLMKAANSLLASPHNELRLGAGIIATYVAHFNGPDAATDAVGRELLIDSIPGIVGDFVRMAFFHRSVPIVDRMMARMSDERPAPHWRFPGMDWPTKPRTVSSIIKSKLEHQMGEVACDFEFPMGSPPALHRSDLSPKDWEDPEKIRKWWSVAREHWSFDPTSKLWKKVVDTTLSMKVGETTTVATVDGSPPWLIRLADYVSSPSPHGTLVGWCLEIEAPPPYGNSREGCYNRSLGTAGEGSTDRDCEVTMVAPHAASGKIRIRLRKWGLK